MSGWRLSKPVARREGSILIEVMVAVVLLGIIVVPLATGAQSAVQRAETVQEQSAGASADVAGAGVGEAWKWGPAVARGWWTPGPVLHIDLEESKDVALVVGLWVDGWFMSEESPDSDGRLSVRSQAWSDCVGRELLVRVREPGDAWGPPWRSFVPSFLGEYPFPAAQADGAEADAYAAAGAEIVAHVPALASPQLTASWLPLEAQPEVLGLPFLLPSCTPGWCELTLDGKTQSWLMEAGRALDVYF